MIKYYLISEDDYKNLYRYNDEENKYYLMENCYTGNGFWKEISNLDITNLVEITSELAMSIASGKDSNNNYIENSDKKTKAENEITESIEQDKPTNIIDWIVRNKNKLLVLGGILGASALSFFLGKNFGSSNSSKLKEINEVLWKRI